MQFCTKLFILWSQLFRNIIERTHPQKSAERSSAMMAEDNELLFSFKKARDMESQQKDKVAPQLRQEEVRRLVTGLCCIFLVVLALLVRTPPDACFTYLFTPPFLLWLSRSCYSAWCSGCGLVQGASLWGSQWVSGTTRTWPSGWGVWGNGLHTTTPRSSLQRSACECVRWGSAVVEDG